MSASKTVCPISKAMFQAQAKAITVVIDGKPYVAQMKEFSSGSFGWNVSDKVTLEIGGTPVRCQIGLNITAIGSKDASKGELAEAA
jgi:hypothetical protein